MSLIPSHSQGTPGWCFSQEPKRPCGIVTATVATASPAGDVSILSPNCLTALENADLAASYCLAS
jgi:hypothetical protein